MRAYRYDSVNGPAVLQRLKAVVARERSDTAEVLAHIAEADERRLYVPEGYPSMHAYCVEELNFSEDSASKRIQAARAARNFPVIFTALAEGKLHLSAVVLLAPHLTPQNVCELIDEATKKTKAQIQLMLARRFPRTEELPLVQRLPASASVRGDEHAPGHVDDAFTNARPSACIPHSKSTPVAPGRFALQLMIDQETHDLMDYARTLSSHGARLDISVLIKSALKVYVAHLEKRKFGSTARPRRRRPTTNPRTIPVSVKRAVWERDGGRCTFVSESGRRCAALEGLEFDHIIPVARGGQATVDNLRIRCRAHNLFEAERMFGTEFMKKKRDEARRDAAEARALRSAEEVARCSVEEIQSRQGAEEDQAARRAADEEWTRLDGERRARAAEEAAAREAVEEQEKDVIAGLRSLGFRMEQARRAVERTANMSNATLEERMRAALRSMRPTPISNGHGAANSGSLA